MRHKLRYIKKSTLAGKHAQMLTIKRLNKVLERLRCGCYAVAVTIFWLIDVDEPSALVTSVQAADLPTHTLRLCTEIGGAGPSGL